MSGDPDQSYLDFFVLDLDLDLLFTAMMLNDAEL